ncbi:3'-5' exoribonuclease YhaM [Salicibibacter halophilus]|uniref:3'-5' exoribonuclease YhaM n=1 Tax=Salicibibacter halophilus TaxID=2502791 RepID=A0A514LMW9_9BACI|nr:3'-5' exoribonuclease YhaM [Salicibibacter halophilus]QDI93202.1 3'-5' exoribonuclease YhaM [Salicibibacter halophilus]
MEKGIYYAKPGDKIDRHLLIRQATRGIASNGKPFLTLRLSDDSGDIEAKLWGVKPEDERTYTGKTIVYIQGEAFDYRGRLQLKITRIRPVNDQDNIKMEDLVPTAPMEKLDMLEHVNQFVFDIGNAKIQRMTRFLLKKYQHAFLESPAATRNHHEFMSGLAYHVVCMLQLAQSVVQLYPSLNKDLLYAGIILHDLGKVRELSGPIDTEYTPEGKLIGHISIMAAEIRQTASELKIEGEEPMLLEHLILSHHGKGEWGSPKPPLVQEAEILHYIDNLDAKMNMMDRALGKTEAGHFTERIPALENRTFYKPKNI